MLGSSLRGAVRAARAPRLVARPAARAYHENIIDHYESPRNVGSLDKNDPSVGTGLVGAPACGDVMKLQMSIKDGRVENAVFKVSIRPPSRPAVATPAPAAASKTHRTAARHARLRSLLADVWVRLGDRELVVRDRVAEGQDYRRVRRHPELRHRLLPQVAPGEAALLHVRAVPPRARPERPLHTRLAPCLASLASHPSRLAEDAVKLAIKDYQSKQEERDAVAKAAAAE